MLWTPSHLERHHDYVDVFDRFTVSGIGRVNLFRQLLVVVHFTHLIAGVAVQSFNLRKRTRLSSGQFSGLLLT
jgi:hypothetical protein